VTYLVEHHKLLGLIKAERKRHREHAAHSSEIWAGSSYSRCQVLGVRC
jgi:hypothetical protein